MRNRARMAVRKATSESVYGAAWRVAVSNLSLADGERTEGRAEIALVNRLRNGAPEPNAV